MTDIQPFIDAISCECGRKECQNCAATTKILAAFAALTAELAAVTADRDVLQRQLRQLQGVMVETLSRNGV